MWRSRTSAIDQELRRRQGGYGRGGRQRIETDRVEILTGIWRGVSLGSPIALQVVNKDYKLERMEDLTRPRPGHGDLAERSSIWARSAAILERASARETAVRVAAGALAKQLLDAFGIRAMGYVVELGGIGIEVPQCSWEERLQLREQSEVYGLDPDVTTQIKQLIDQTGKAGDTLGGVVEVCVEGLPFGLGTHAQWDQKLDGRIAQAVMAVQAIKGVEIGLGFEAARRPGSQVHDPIQYDAHQSHGAHTRLHASHEQCRRPGGWHDQRSALDRACCDEADQHAAQTARIDQSEDEASRVGGVRAKRCLCRVGGERDCGECRGV